MTTLADGREHDHTDRSSLDLPEEDLGSVEDAREWRIEDRGDSRAAAPQMTNVRRCRSRTRVIWPITEPSVAPI